MSDPNPITQSSDPGIQIPESNQTPAPENSNLDSPAPHQENPFVSPPSEEITKGSEDSGCGSYLGTLLLSVVVIFSVKIGFRACTQQSYSPSRPVSSQLAKDPASWSRHELANTDISLDLPAPPESVSMPAGAEFDGLLKQKAYMVKRGKGSIMLHQIETTRRPAKPLKEMIEGMLKGTTRTVPGLTYRVESVSENKVRITGSTSGYTPNLTLSGCYLSKPNEKNKKGVTAGGILVFSDSAYEDESLRLRTSFRLRGLDLDCM
jgi:hypothetical protein